MIKKLVIAAALALATFFGTNNANASGSCLFDAHVNVTAPYVVEVNGTPNGTFVPPSNGENGDWFGNGIISTGTDCEHLTGPSFSILIPANWIGNNPSPLTAGTIQISCWKRNPDGSYSVVNSAPVNLVIDPYCTQCTFQFYVSVCDNAGGCVVSVCKTCLAPAGQQ